MSILHMPLELIRDYASVHIEVGKTLQHNLFTGKEMRMEMTDEEIIFYKLIAQEIAFISNSYSYETHKLGTYILFMYEHAVVTIGIADPLCNKRLVEFRWKSNFRSDHIIVHSFEIADPQLFDKLKKLVEERSNHGDQNT